MDAPEEDAAEEDASVPPDGLGECHDAASTLIYVVTLQRDLMSFYPPTTSFSLIGHLACPSTGVPNSMAIDRNGVAYVNYDTGEIFRVSTDTATCETTPFVIGQAGFPPRLGMTFSVDRTSGLETLFVAGNTGLAAGSLSPFGTLDANTFLLSKIGDMDPVIVAPALTTTGNDVWAFFLDRDASPTSTFGQIWTDSGGLQSEGPLSLDPGSAWTLVFWGNAFYFFTAPAGMTFVNLQALNAPYSTNAIATSSEQIVGAAVALCAP